MVGRTVVKIRRAVDGARTPAGRRALRRGVAPSEGVRHLLRRLGPDFILDIGANRGQFTLAVRTALPDARVLAFEPLESESRIFQEIHGADPLVELLPYALSDSAGTASFHVSGHADSSSMLPPSTLQSDIFPGTQTVETVTVETHRLDDLDARLDLSGSILMKIDVQGHELGVLRGAEAVLHRTSWILVEASFVELYEEQPLAHEVIAHLADRGFALVDMLEPTRRNGRTLQVDLVFERVTAS